MPMASNRLRKQTKRVNKEIHKMNGTVKNAAQERLRAIRSKGADGYEAARSSAYGFRTAILQVIRRRPTRFALFATGVGVLLGGFWFRHLVRARVRSKTEA